MNAPSLGLALPYNAEAEAGLLGAMLANASAYPRVADMLKPEHFHVDVHQRIYEAIAKQIGQGKPATPITVKDHFRAGEEAGGQSIPAYLLHLHANATSLINVHDYGQLIRDLWAKRCMIAFAGEISDLAQDHKASGADQILQHLQGRMTELDAALSTATVPVDAKAAADTVLRRVRGAAGDHEKPIPLPFAELRRVAQGRIKPGRLYGFLAASGEGKTSFILHLMRHAAENGNPSALLSFDQSEDECVDQMIRQATRITEQKVEQRRLTTEELAAYEAEAAKIADLPIAFPQCTDGRIEAVQAQARKFIAYWARRSVKAPIIVVDHIASLTDTNPRADAGSKAAEKTRAFKAFAKSTGAAVIMVTQRNSTNADKLMTRIPRPTIWDLEGGESARRDYDTVIGLFNPAFWRDKVLQTIPESAGKAREKIEAMYGDCDERMEVNLIKARHGNPRLRGKLRFEGQYTRISDPSEEAEQPSLIDEPEMPF